MKLVLTGAMLVLATTACGGGGGGGFEPPPAVRDTVYILPYFGEAEVRELIDGTYRVIYRVLEDEIHILTVRHVPRLLPARAFER